MTKSYHFITHEIGSLAKPEWRVIGVTDKPIQAAHIKEVMDWAKKLSLDPAPVLSLLAKKKKSTADKVEIRRRASIFAIKLQEVAGLDVIYDGEQQRVEMYEYPVAHSQGFTFKGHVRSWDNKYYRKAAVIARPKINKPWHDDEFLWAKKFATKELKVPITGAYTIAAWSYDECYTKKSFALGTKKGREQRKEARRYFVLDVARNLIRPNILSLVAKGAGWIQIDEPAVTTYPEDIPLFVESFNESIRGIKNCKFGIHICFSDYTKLFPHLQKINNCYEYTFEFANRDSKELGIGKDKRVGYDILAWFKKYRIPAKIGLGVIDIHTDFIEPPELVRDRILYAVKIMGDPAKINVTTDCGLRTRTLETSFAKMKNMVAGARLAEALL